ncbi:Tox-REase-5 domain-containing protein [Archangium sp.]|uniref:Tox-REase-5 domain-containing protein n=1 Tax=Archangium sp. TaxID=1872627 RepID=UPI002D340416|nr:Tox-REase-5 domain-containing protein [Archangium sp.]HYO55130.1 Tox-REase-5 domain-containing protein [Archangium sp.]
MTKKNHTLLVALVVVGGGATSHPRGTLLSGDGHRPLTPAFLADTRPGQGASAEEEEGSGGGFFEEKADSFQVVQEASGLGEEERHPAGAALYVEQVTGQPAWRVYEIDGVEFDGFTGKELQEAKGPNYVNFFKKDGTPQDWYVRSGKFNQLLKQAENQSRTAEQVKLPLTWYVADAKVAELLREIFENRGWKNITVHHTRPAR